MADTVVQPEMINRTACCALRDADIEATQAEVVAAHLPDWSQLATKQDLNQGLAQLESRLIRWMVGIFVGSVMVVGGLLTVLLTIVNSYLRHVILIRYTFATRRFGRRIRIG